MAAFLTPAAVTSIAFLKASLPAFAAIAFATPGATELLATSLAMPAITSSVRPSTPFALLARYAAVAIVPAVLIAHFSVPSFTVAPTRDLTLLTAPLNSRPVVRNSRANAGIPRTMEPTLPPQVWLAWRCMSSMYSLANTNSWVVSLSTPSVSILRMVSRTLDMLRTEMPRLATSPAYGIKSSPEPVDKASVNPRRPLRCLAINLRRSRPPACAKISLRETTRPYKFNSAT